MFDVVVELDRRRRGRGPRPGRAALRAKKHVVTANKALLARHWRALAALAERHGVSLKFEAAICGGIPIVKVAARGLIAYEISAVRGILNGTCNFILTQMEATGGLLPRCWPKRSGSVTRRPIRRWTSAAATRRTSSRCSPALPSARSPTSTASPRPASTSQPGRYRLCRRVRLPHASCSASRGAPANGIEQLVNPAMVTAGTPLADVESSFNAVAADAGEAGTVLFPGRGAGAGPTASAVITDLVDVARGAFGPPSGGRRRS
jgi:homoserine dehydrogenase